MSKKNRGEKMEKLRPSDKIFDIGLDSGNIFTHSFKLNKSFRDEFLRVTKSGERTTKKIKIPYLNDKKNCFSAELIDDYRGKGLIINFSFPKFFNTHNLYFMEIKYAKRILKVIKRKLEDIGVLSKIKDYAFLDYEIGYNVVNSNMAKEQKTLFKVMSKATKKKHSIFGKNINNSLYSYIEDDRVIGRSALRGADRFKNYCKTNEMLDRQQIEVQMNVTRSELLFNKKDLENKIGTNNCLKTIKHMSNLYKDRIDTIFSNIKDSELKDREVLKNRIKKFKSKNKQGLPKFLKSIEYFDKKTLIKALEDLHGLLNRQSKRYIKIVEEEIEDQQEKFNEIKERLNNFFCIGFTKPMQKPEGFEPSKSIDNKGNELNFIGKISDCFFPVSKIEDGLIKNNFEE